MRLHWFFPTGYGRSTAENVTLNRFYIDVSPSVQVTIHCMHFYLVTNFCQPGEIHCRGAWAHGHEKLLFLGDFSMLKTCWVWGSIIHDTPSLLVSKYLCTQHCNFLSERNKCKTRFTDLRSSQIRSEDLQILCSFLGWARHARAPRVLLLPYQNTETFININHHERCIQTFVAFPEK